MDDNLKSAWERFQERAQQERKEGGTTGPIFSQLLAEFLASHTPADYLINGLLRRGWFYGCTALGTTGKTALAQLLTKLIAKDQRRRSSGRTKSNTARSHTSPAKILMICASASLPIWICRPASRCRMTRCGSSRCCLMPMRLTIRSRAN
jgi:hypothetical protein